MSLREIVRFALGGLNANRLRSALTTLGILIGVAAVIVLVAVGNGSSRAVAASLEGLGTNAMTVLPGSFAFPGQAQATPIGAQDLTVDDVRALNDPEVAPDVKHASPVVNAQVTCTYEGSSHDTSLTGTWPGWFETSSSPVSRGTYFSDADVVQGRRTIVLGQTVVDNLYGSVDPLDTTVVCGGVPFTVVGVLAEKGSSGFQDGDDAAVAPLTTVQRSVTGYGGLASISVQATSPGTVSSAQAQVEAVLDERHGVEDLTQRDFQVLNQASLLSATNESNEVFTVLLGAVAAISLLVGGIGITNIMLVTVTERTREIGIRKAIGARRRAILGQFLVEATLLSVIGGALGVALGLLGSQFEIVGVDPVVVPSSVLLAFGVSVVIGLFFGSFPANRAASLRPIEALRHE